MVLEPVDGLPEGRPAREVAATIRLAANSLPLGETVCGAAPLPSALPPGTDLILASSHLPATSSSSASGTSRAPEIARM